MIVGGTTVRKQELHILFKINGVWLLKSCRCIRGHGRERQCEDWASEATRQNSSYFAKMCLLGRHGSQTCSVEPDFKF